MIVAHEIALDWPAFTFLFLVCLVTAVIFGLAPALVTARIDVNIAANRSSGALWVGRRYGRMRDGLVVLEVALAFVLALGAAALMREVHRLKNVDPGIVTDNVITLHLTPNAPARDYYAIEDRVGRLPGVEAAG